MKEYRVFVGNKKNINFNELDENNIHTFYNFFKGLNSRFYIHNQAITE